MGTGEAAVTVLSDRGAPTPVAWTRLVAPRGSMDPEPVTTLDRLVADSALYATYATAVDRESAYELLTARAAAAAEQAAHEEAEEAAGVESTSGQRTSSSKLVQGDVGDVRGAGLEGDARLRPHHRARGRPFRHPLSVRGAQPVNAASATSIAASLAAIGGLPFSVCSGLLTYAEEFTMALLGPPRPPNYRQACLTRDTLTIWTQ